MVETEQQISMQLLQTSENFAVTFEHYRAEADAMRPATLTCRSDERQNRKAR